MGGLLDKPITEKRSSAGESDRMRWSATDMQGWRQDMEDEHIAHADLGEEFANVGLYCVFDGHGGKAVSRFCEKEFTAELRLQTVEVGRKAFGKNKSKKRHCGAALEAKDFEQILTETFHAMDKKLQDPATAKTLARLVGKVPGGAIEDLKKKLSKAQSDHQQGKLSCLRSRR